jgi:hypothetical protein
MRVHLCINIDCGPCLHNPEYRSKLCKSMSRLQCEDLHMWHYDDIYFLYSITSGYRGHLLFVCIYGALLGGFRCVGLNLYRSAGRIQVCRTEWEDSGV